MAIKKNKKKKHKKKRKFSWTDEENEDDFEEDDYESNSVVNNTDSSYEIKHSKKENKNIPFKQWFSLLAFSLQEPNKLA